MNGLHEQFVAEARELIHQATDDLIAVEREGFALERIERVFRAFHTLKGSAGVVGLPAMGLSLHAAEDLLAAIHTGKLNVTSAIIDRALSCLDQAARWVDEFEAGGALPPHAGEEARMMAARLRDSAFGGRAPRAGAIGGAHLGGCGRLRTAGLGRPPDRIPAFANCGAAAAASGRNSWLSPTSRTPVASSTAMTRSS